MKCEGPVVTRCCFCLPLRHGVLAAGYIKFIYSAFMVGVHSFVVHRQTDVMALFVHVSANKLASELGLMFYLVELVTCVLVLYGAHMRAPYCLKVYFYYGLMTSTAILLVEAVQWMNHPSTLIELLAIFVAIYFLEIYLLIILWNLIKKMKASESECENPLQHFTSSTPAAVA